MNRYLLILSLFVASLLQAKLQPFDGVAAYVDEKVITIDTVINELYTANQLWKAPLQQQLIANQTYFPVFLDLLIDRILILKEYEASGMNLPQQHVDEMVQRTIANNFDGNEAILHAELRRVGITYPEWLKQMRENAIVDAMRYLQVDKKINVSPKRVREYYAAHPEQFTIADGMQISTILISPDAGRATADVVLQALRSGGDFAELAKENSCDEYAEMGGFRDFIKPEEHFNAEIVDAINRLKTGDISDVIEMNGYCLIVKKGEIRGGTLRPLKDVWPVAEKAVRAQLAQARYAQWIETLRAKANIRIMSLGTTNNGTEE
jgi:parvulin-like peptidyl-prolyl isomerase